MSINSSLKVYSAEPLDSRAVGAGTTWEGKSGEVTGLVRFDTTDGEGTLKVYDGQAWRKIVDQFTDDIDTLNLTANIVTCTTLDTTAFTTNNVTCTTLNCPTFTAPAGISVNNTSGVTSSNAVTCLTCDGSYDGMSSSFVIQMQQGGGSGSYAAAKAALKMQGGGLGGVSIGHQNNANAYLDISAGRSISYRTPTTASYMGHYFQGYVFTFNGSNVSSDDRLKWEEVPIANGLSVINRLQPQVYWKGNTLNVEPAPTERRRESGFIAQEVEQIPELAHAVRQSVNDDGSNSTYFLDYAQLHAYQVAATNELHTLVRQQQALIEALTARVAALEA